MTLERQAIVTDAARSINGRQNLEKVLNAAASDWRHFLASAKPECIRLIKKSRHTLLPAFPKFVGSYIQAQG